MANQEPKRWAELGSDAPDAVRTLLSRAREDLPSQAELRSLGLIGGVIAPFDGGGDLTGPASKAGPIAHGAAGSGASSSGSFAKLALLAKLGASGLVVAGGATWLLMREPAVDTPVVTTNTTETVAPAPVAAPEPNASVVAPLPEVSITPKAEAPAPPRADTSARAGAPTSEAALLQRAQASLAKNPARALALAEQHAKQFPRGQLTQEREVIRIEALRRLGRDNQAEKVGRDFERQFPDSPHRRKLDQSEP